MKKDTARLLVCVFILGMACPSGAAVLTILGDYDATGDLDDVIHLGDGVYVNLHHDNPLGASWELQFSFETMGAPLPESGGQFSLYISQYGANPGRGFFDHIFLNGADLGCLSVDSEVFWCDEGPFTASDNLFVTGDNTLTVYSGKSMQPGEDPSNWDDFEFTNLFIDYDAAIPAPGAILLGTLGAGLVGWLRRRRGL